MVLSLAAFLEEDRCNLNGKREGEDGKWKARQGIILLCG